MVSWWERNSYLNNELIQISDIVLNNTANCSSGSFGSIFRSKYIVNNTYIGRRINSRSKPTPIHGPVIKSTLKSLYSRVHFNCLSQAGNKELINRLSQKVSYDYTMINTIINIFSTHEVRSQCNICDH